ncbi:hypothetical protein Acor_40220 [Acrocarpospora corrugata]|uniref:DUF3618 domain-containing protein n=1 Tax=Acrocarpospora corrugata TaxID=35763 RepID=A0A5M3VYL4_9ACTN|nr:DUF3618 domain-containing protein [Acrocarpospora corrugata]GES01957.1 hypothetical protein Acor_40220 [Acrocarpospora corrugata]
MADTDPAALERKIERTRTELARTVDAIADRVSPKRVAGRNVAKVKAQAEHVVTTIGDFMGAQRSNGVISAGHLANGVAPATANDTARAGESEGWEDDYPPPNIAPVLIGVGVALAVGAAILIMRRRRRR